jgi:RNA polymerase sigma factor (sigma-70 family)
MSQGTPSLLLAAIAHRDELSAFVRKSVRCPSIAADIVQDIFLRLLSGPNTSDVNNPRAYLFRAAANLVIDHHRAEGRRRLSQTEVSEILDLADDKPGPEAAVTAREDLQRLQEALAELPPRRRDIFRLSRIEKLGHREIAERFGITTRTVENEIARALSHCAGRLEKNS